MKTTPVLAALASLATLAACGSNSADQTNTATIANAPADAPAGDPAGALPSVPQPAPAPAPAAPTTPAPANTAEQAPDLSPPPLVPEAERGEKGARNVLLSFARAIELKQFGQAWAMLSPGDKARWSRSAFAANFADLGKITVAVPGGTMEGAAGSLYYEAPITITGTDRDGRPVRYEGTATLRRVNDVDGATPAQLRWHFDNLKLDWTH
ncbi:hypothetical protein GCM10022280_03920 [Sphingomonas swuensis]|uniref:Lipoprotein n=1 Tax=Sphingomonas swuensis TaxID=977800 RepID=A0ABP7SCS9_9SPHN